MVRVREAIGPDIKLMCDHTSAAVEQAIDIGRRVEDAGGCLFWLEDVRRRTIPWARRVTAALSTPVRAAIRSGASPVPPHGRGAPSTS